MSPVRPKALLGQQLAEIFVLLEPMWLSPRRRPPQILNQIPDAAASQHVLVSSLILSRPGGKVTTREAAFIEVF